MNTRKRTRRCYYYGTSMIDNNNTCPMNHHNIDCCNCCCCYDENQSVSFMKQYCCANTTAIPCTNSTLLHRQNKIHMNTNVVAVAVVHYTKYIFTCLIQNFCTSRRMQQLQQQNVCKQHHRLGRMMKKRFVSFSTTTPQRLFTFLVVVALFIMQKPITTKTTKPTLTIFVVASSNSNNNYRNIGTPSGRSINRRQLHNVPPPPPPKPAAGVSKRNSSSIRLSSSSFTRNVPTTIRDNETNENSYDFYDHPTTNNRRKDQELDGIMDNDNYLDNDNSYWNTNHDNYNNKDNVDNIRPYHQQGSYDNDDDVNRNINDNNNNDDNIDPGDWSSSTSSTTSSSFPTEHEEINQYNNYASDYSEQQEGTTRDSKRNSRIHEPIARNRSTTQHLPPTVIKDHPKNAPQKLETKQHNPFSLSRLFHREGKQVEPAYINKNKQQQPSSLLSSSSLASRRTVPPPPRQSNPFDDNQQQQQPKQTAQKPHPLLDVSPISSNENKPQRQPIHYQFQSKSATATASLGNNKHDPNSKIRRSSFFSSNQQEKEENDSEFQTTTTNTTTTMSPKQYDIITQYTSTYIGQIKLILSCGFVGYSFGYFLDQSIGIKSSSSSLRLYVAIAFVLSASLLRHSTSSFGEFVRSTGMTIILLLQRSKTIRQQYPTVPYLKEIILLRNNKNNSVRNRNRSASRYRPFPPVRPGTSPWSWKQPTIDNDTNARVPYFNMLYTVGAMSMIGAIIGGNLPSMFLLPTWFNTLWCSGLFVYITSVIPVGVPVGDLARICGMRIVCLILEIQNINNEIHVVQKTFIVIGKIFDKCMILDRKHRIKDRIIIIVSYIYQFIMNIVSEAQRGIQQQQQQSQQQPVQVQPAEPLMNTRRSTTSNVMDGTGSSRRRENMDDRDFGNNDGRYRNNNEQRYRQPKMRTTKNNLLDDDDYNNTDDDILNKENSMW